MNDLATWSCWQIDGTTNNRKVGIMFMRRKNIPPLGDTFQDISFIFSAPKINLPKPQEREQDNEDEKGKEEKEEAPSWVIQKMGANSAIEQNVYISEVLEPMVDSLSPTIEYKYDRDAISLRVDNLEYDARSFGWASNELNLFPNIYNSSKEFYKAAFTLLEQLTERDYGISVSLPGVNGNKYFQEIFSKKTNLYFFKKLRETEVLLRLLKLSILVSN